MEMEFFKVFFHSFPDSRMSLCFSLPGTGDIIHYSGRKTFIHPVLLFSRNVSWLIRYKAKPLTLYACAMSASRAGLGGTVVWSLGLLSQVRTRRRWVVSLGW